MRASPWPEETFSPASGSATRLRGGVSLHLVGDGGILLDSASQRLYSVNTTATFIWFCFEDGLSPEESRQRLQRTFGTTEADAKHYVTDAIREWTMLGFLNDGAKDAGEPGSRTGTDIDCDDGPKHAVLDRPFVAVSERHYRLLDTDFRLRFASHSAEKDIHPFLIPLSEAASGEADPVVIDVREENGRRALCSGNQVIERWAAADEIVPVAKIALVTLALERSRDFGALHGAAVCRRPDAPCVIIAGVSGSGKSTLTAGLVTDGFFSLGDDTVVLARDTLAVRAVPFGICLKEGAWDLLSRRLPTLADQPIHQRLDGKRVRYFVPEGGIGSPGRGMQNPVQAIVFPRRTADGPACLLRVSHADALSRLASEFCPLGGVLDAEKVEHLIQWVKDIACFELRFATLDEGTKRIGELCA
jgi:hypothetical protein